MHVARRTYLLVMLIAVLAVVGIWSQQRALEGLWRFPAALLLLGLALEGAFVRRLLPAVQLRIAPRAYLGRALQAALVFTNARRRPLTLEYACAAPDGVEAPQAARRVHVPGQGSYADTLPLLPVRLGPQQWPALPARLRGPLALAWWNCALSPAARFRVAPDVLRGRARVRGFAGGARPRRVPGAGQELYQLRGYVRGDALGRIDWKATARSGALMTREYSEDQHLDVVVLIDAGRLSRVRCGALDRFALYGNIAASFAELVAHNDDRIGVTVYADEVLGSCMPARGLGAVVRLRALLEQLVVRPAESDPVTAAMAVRRMLRHRALVVVLTDLDDLSVADALARAVRVLAPPHLVLVAGVHTAELEHLARAPARSWQDPWVALAASEHLARAAARREVLQRLGAPLVAAPPERLQDELFARYQLLRQSRRI